jgi:glycogen debranching enzyme
MGVLQSGVHIMKTTIVFLTVLSLLGGISVQAQEGLLPAFELEPNDLLLQRPASPGTPFDKVGRRFAILGDESGSFEAWAYPLKLLRGFSFSFFIGSSTRAIPAADIVRFIDVTPEATVLTYTYQSFTARAVFITSVKKPGALILLRIDSTEPLSVVCGFLPVLQPMWPAGIGGQFAYWNNDLKAYLISESSGKNHALVGSPAASGLSYTPAHMLSDAPSEFRIDIPAPDAARGKYIPIALAGGRGKRDSVTAVYKKLLADPEQVYRDNLAHYGALRKNTLQVITPDEELNLAFAWAKVAFDNLMVDHPELGTGMVAGLGASGTSGRPGFGWFFGGDTYINSLSLSSYGAFDSARAALGFTRQWQREDGKMAHELSQAEGYIDWWGDYPYGYIHGDTSPYYIAAVYDYVRWSGDRDFVKESWASLQKAFEWCLLTDANRDGLMDNREAGLGALEYGALTGIETDIYLGAVWVRAAYAMLRLARIVGDTGTSDQAAKAYQVARAAFEERFWDEDNLSYAYAFNADGECVKEISPWSSVGLMWKLGTPEHSRLTLERICSAELVTDWGVRSISIDSRYFQPLNYNYGAVWPFLTSWVTTALYKHHMPLQAFGLLKAMARHTFNHGLGTITEVFSGTHHVWPQEAVSHQGFSTAAVTLPLIRGLLGLEAEAPSRSLTFAPNPPPDWDSFRITNLRVGEAVFSLEVDKTRGRMRIRTQTQNAAGWTLRFAPALPLGSRVESVEINKRSTEFETIEQNQINQVSFEVQATDEPQHITIHYSPGPEIVAAGPDSRVGDGNRGLKIISMLREGSEQTMILEGLSGTQYELGLLNGELVSHVSGGKLVKDRLFVRFPEGKPGEFIRLSVVLHLVEQKQLTSGAFQPTTRS